MRVKVAKGLKLEAVKRIVIKLGYGNVDVATKRFYEKPIKEQLRFRNAFIIKDYYNGATTSTLTSLYQVSERTIQRIIARSRSY